MQWIHKSEATAGKRRVFFVARSGTDGLNVLDPATLTFAVGLAKSDLSIAAATNQVVASVDAANAHGMLGLCCYTPDPADLGVDGAAVFAISATGATNMETVYAGVDVSEVDKYDANAFGLARLDENVSAAKSVKAGGIASTAFAAGAIDTNAVNATLITAIQSGLATTTGTHADAVAISNAIAALPTAGTIAAAVLAAAVVGTVTLQQAMQILLGGAAMANSYTDQCTYDPVSGFLLGWRTRFYANSTDATTVSNGGVATAIVTITGTATQTASGKVATALKVVS